MLFYKRSAEPGPAKLFHQRNLPADAEQDIKPYSIVNSPRNITTAHHSRKRDNFDLTAE